MVAIDDKSLHYMLESSVLLSHKISIGKDEYLLASPRVWSYNGTPITSHELTSRLVDAFRKGYDCKFEQPSFYMPGIFAGVLRMFMNQMAEASHSSSVAGNVNLSNWIDGQYYLAEALLKSVESRMRG